MEANSESMNRKRARNQADSENPESATMAEPRKIVKAKRRNQKQGTDQKDSAAMEENKEDLSFEDSQEDEFEVEDVVD